MSGRMDSHEDTPDSVQNTEPAPRSIYAQSGPTHKMETVVGNLILNSSSDGTSALKEAIPTKMPEDVSNLYLNDGMVVEAGTITKDVTITHTIRKPQ